MLELFFQEIIFTLIENNFFLIPGWIESTNFIMNTYVNVAFLRLLLSAEQLAKSDQHLEEELMFCAQANPLSQWGTYLPWINLLLHTSLWFTYDRPDVCLDIGDLLYGLQLLLRGERSGYLYLPRFTGEAVTLDWSTREYRHFGWIFPPFTEYLGACISRWTEVCWWESGWRHDVAHVQVFLPHGSLPCGWCTRSHAVIISTWKSHEDGNKGYRLSAYTAPL